MDKNYYFSVLNFIISIFTMSLITFNGFSQKVCVVQAYFDATPLQVCTGDSILFDNRTGGYIDDTLAFNWDYDGGASDDSISGINPTGCFFNGVPLLTPCQTFYKQFNTVGNYSVQLFVYNLNTNTGLYIPADAFSRTITVVDSTAWGFINTLTNFECNTPFWVTDSSFNLLPTQNFMGGVTSIFWTLYDYNLGVSNTYYSQIGDTLNIQTFGTNGLIDLPIGQYWLKMETQSYCNSNIVDSINFFITSGTPDITGTQFMCLGDTAMFIGKSGCPDYWNWNFGDGTTASGNDTVYHVFNQVGSYSVSLQTNNGGAIGLYTIDVINPKTAIIKGNQNNCDSIVFYTIENYDTNYTYTWSTQVYNQTTLQYSAGNFIFLNGNSTIITSDSALINWNTSAFPFLPNYAVISVEAKLKGSNCSSISTLKVFQCCEGDIGGDGFAWHDTIITNALNLTNTYISINGTVVLKDSLTFNKLSGTFGGIFMGSYAKIILDSGAYFEINNGAITAGCKYMWDGVYSNRSDVKIKLQNTNIEHAINGIVSSNGASILANNCTFYSNNIGIQFSEHRPQLSFPAPPFTPIVAAVTNCTFISHGSYFLEYHPLQGHQSYAGIMVSNVKGLEIGSATAGGNTFEKMVIGVSVYNSKVNLYNNTFNLIEDQVGFYNTHGAIIINSKPLNDMLNIADVTVGGSGTMQNKFNNCRNDIVSNNSKLTVSNNILKGSFNSVEILNFKSGTSLTNNRFKDVSFGIRVFNPIAVNRRLEISSNYFEGVTDNSYSQVTQNAINVVNSKSQPNTSVKTTISNNTIKYAGIKTSITSGIRIQNCDGIMVNSNFIARMPGSIGNINNDWDKTIGIRTATCQGAQITDNYIWGFGQSITTYGNLTGTQFSCNELKIYKYGFYWDALTSLSNQGIANLRNTHNEWASHPNITANEKLANIASSYNNILNGPINWYYFDNMGTQWIPNDVGASPFIIDAIIKNNATHLCVGGSGSGNNGGGGTSTGGGNTGTGTSTPMSLLDEIRDPKLRDWMFEDLIQGEAYVELQNEYRAYDADFLYKLLADDTTMMWLGGTKDADYQYFFDSIQESNIGEFEKIYQLIEQGEYNAALALNTEITPEQAIFANQKTVLDLFIRTWCMERYELSSQEYETLYQIASLTPYEGGEAVYTARIMIGFEPDEHNIPYLPRPSKAEKTPELLSLYPNPASEEVTVTFENPKFENVQADLKIYSLSGKLVDQKQFETINSFYLINLSNLSNGVYLFHIELSNGLSQNGKLVILKQ